MKMLLKSQGKEGDRPECIAFTKTSITSNDAESFSLYSQEHFTFLWTFPLHRGSCILGNGVLSLDDDVLYACISLLQYTPLSGKISL